MNIDPELQKSITEARALAASYGHDVYCAEHLLAALMSNTPAREAIEACSGNPGKIEAAMISYLDNTIGDAGKQEIPVENVEADVSITKLMQRAMLYVKSRNEQEVTGVDLLPSFFAERDSFAATALMDQGMHRFDVVNWISHGVKKRDEQEGARGLQTEMVGSKGSETRKSDGSVLNEYATDLCKRAMDGKIDGLVGRSKEVERTAKILCRRSKNNPIFVGDAGVGKTAIVEGLAKKIVDGDVPSALKDCKVYSLDLTSMLAGARFRGDFEERMKMLLEEVKDDPKVIIFIDEIHAALGAGSGSQGALDAANMLKPALARGEFRCIGATTQNEYRQYFEKDAAMSRRFQKIGVEEPSRDEAVEILNGLKPKLEEHHSVTYGDGVIEAAVDLAIRYVNHRKLPDKAIDIIDEAGASYSSGEVKPYNGEAVVSLKDIEHTVSEMSGVPIKSAGQSERAALKTLSENLKQSVFGQDEAVDSITNAIKVAKAGLRNKDKPVGSFLFCGPTGVGKTELTRQLGEAMSLKVHRFDMSEYMEKHAVSRMVGAPPGYVGHEKGGLLTEAVEKTPHSIVLLDEVEKAHPDMFNLLLQVMDYGKLTDSNGREVDFRNTIIIMTSNAGAEDMTKPKIGFIEDKETKGNEDALKHFFSPEFRNRLDAVVTFRALPKSAVGLVVDKMIFQLEANLVDARVTIEVDDEARDWLGEQGYDPKMGARPLERVIQEKISKPLADEILFGELVDGGNIKISMDAGSDGLNFEFEPATQREAQMAL